MAYYAKQAAQNADRLDAVIEHTMDEQIASLVEQIKIPSEKKESEGKYPFGEAMQRSLDHALALGRKMGFSTRDLDGYAGVIEYGEGEETLGVLAHLDVVPAGTGWSVDPFGGEIKDGFIYGRGTSDDKGPAIHALYALNAIRECGIKLQKKVQIILGCDEESGWACMDHFKKVEKMPDVAFSPDAEYPLVHSEMAIVHATYRAKTGGSKLRLHCGGRANVVPGEATAVVYCDVPKMSLPEGFELKKEADGDMVKLTVKGLGAHASLPDNGKNALQMLIRILYGLALEPEDQKLVSALFEAFQMDKHGETLGLDAQDESGRLTLNPGVLNWTEEEAVLEIDSRVPHCEKGRHVIDKILEKLGAAGFELVTSNVKEGLFVPTDSPLVQSLMGVYQAHTGDMDAKPLAIGGGTYARAMPVAVAFGCEFEGDPGLAHMPDERIPLERLRVNTKILADAIIALAE
ncbi:Sapep family Mn(2+)-dependent dipeptidase [Christensenellaceae bacterium OttesenSCG-928-M15]|nr:Sapep family Mn(2+)-dependent dipeptidase [Christensenellaceae bacterium OttesenSCG-928-M15]